MDEGFILTRKEEGKGSVCCLLLLLVLFLRASSDGTCCWLLLGLMSREGQRERGVGARCKEKDEAQWVGFTVCVELWNQPYQWFGLVWLRMVGSLVPFRC